MTTTPDYAGLMERLLYRVENPSAWPEGFDQDASDLMAEAVKLLESNAALERERDEAYVDVFDAAIRTGKEKLRARKAEAERDRLAERVAELEAAIDRVLKPAPGVRKPEPWIYGVLGTARSLVTGGGDAARAYSDKGDA